MHDFHSPLLSSELRDFTDEISRLFEDLDRTTRRDRRATPGECFPPVDVQETETTIDIVLDVPGVRAEAIRVLIKQGIVLVAGDKVPFDAPERARASFHLVERGFGRFARAVRLTGALDAGRARAQMRNGQLSIVIPKIEDRRGREIFVPVEEPNPR
jgi:HSP20 family protein